MFESSVREWSGTQVGDYLDTAAIGGRIDVDSNIEAAGLWDRPCSAPRWSYLEGVPGGCGLLLERGQEQGQVSVSFER